MIPFIIYTSSSSLSLNEDNLLVHFIGGGVQSLVPLSLSVCIEEHPLCITYYNLKAETFLCLSRELHTEIRSGHTLK